MVVLLGGASGFLHLGCPLCVVRSHSRFLGCGAGRLAFVSFGPFAMKSEETALGQRFPRGGRIRDQAVPWAR